MNQSLQPPHGEYEAALQPKDSLWKLATLTLGKSEGLSVSSCGSVNNDVAVRSPFVQSSISLYLRGYQRLQIVLSIERCFCEDASVQMRN